MYYIYKLTDCNGLTYYGSSENPDERFKDHMTPSNNCSSNKLDRLSMEIEVIETLPIGSTKKDARIRERWYFDNNECVNEVRPFVSDEEFKEKAKEYGREYYNRPEIKEKQKEYNREYYNKPEVKEKQKEYYNRPEVKEKVKEYYNRPEVKEKQKEYGREYYNKPEVKARKKEQYNQKKERKLMGLEDKY